MFVDEEFRCKAGGHGHRGRAWLSRQELLLRKVTEAPLCGCPVCICSPKKASPPTPLLSLAERQRPAPLNQLSGDLLCREGQLERPCHAPATEVKGRPQPSAQELHTHTSHAHTPQPLRPSHSVWTQGTGVATWGLLLSGCKICAAQRPIMLNRKNGNYLPFNLPIQVRHSIARGSGARTQKLEG